MDSAQQSEEGHETEETEQDSVSIPLSSQQREEADPPNKARTSGRTFWTKVVAAIGISLLLVLAQCVVCFTGYLGWMTMFLQIAAFMMWLPIYDIRTKLWYRKYLIGISLFLLLALLVACFTGYLGWMTMISSSMLWPLILILWTWLYSQLRARKTGAVPPPPADKVKFTTRAKATPPKPVTRTPPSGHTDAPDASPQGQTLAGNDVEEAIQLNGAQQQTADSSSNVAVASDTLRLRRPVKFATDPTVQVLDQFRDRFIAEMDAIPIVLELEFHYIISYGDRIAVLQAESRRHQAERLYACLRQKCNAGDLMEACNIITMVKGRPLMRWLGEDMKRALEIGWSSSQSPSTGL